jgi:shikimate dehydrogenase
MKDALNFKQELTAVFGSPVAENPTQVMVEATYRRVRHIVRLRETAK